jgi:PAS domain S-box-containing protein
LQTFSNDKLPELIEILKDSFISVTIAEFNGNIVYVNKVFENRMGYSLSEVNGKNSRFLKSDETNPEKHKKLWETITKGYEWRGELKNKRKNGELIWEYSTIYPIIDANKQIIYFLALKEDISQIKLLEESLAENETKKAKELKYEFLKQISYEIRSPIHSIVDFVQLLSKKLESDDYANCNIYLDIINQQCVKVLDTTELLINISEIKTEVSDVKLNLLDRIFLNNFLKEIKAPISAILGIILLLKEESNKKAVDNIEAGFHVIYSAGERVISTMDIIFECSQNENNEIRFYNNVLSRISEEKEKLKKYSTESVSTYPDIKQIIHNNLTSKKAEDNTEQNKTVPPLPEIKSDTETSFYLFKRNEDLLFETKQFNDITIVFVNTHRATLTDAKNLKNFVFNIIASGSHKLIIDLSLCNNIDTTFAGVIVLIKKNLDEVNGNIVLVFNTKNIYSESFTLLNLELLFEIYPTLESAIRGIK